MSSEDMDSLTFGAPRLVRNLMTPAAAKLPINEYDYDKVGCLPSTDILAPGRWQGRMEPQHGVCTVNLLQSWS